MNSIILLLNYSYIQVTLHMEHFNRLARDAIKNLGTNKTIEIVSRVGHEAGITVILSISIGTILNTSFPVAKDSIICSCSGFICPLL